MKILFRAENPVEGHTTTTKASTKVCMHVAKEARTDVRVMRAATALVDAGFEVSIVDIEQKRTLPAQENIRGVCVKHIINPAWYTSTRFKPWFLVKLASMMLVSAIQLIQTPADIYHAHDEETLPACYIAARLRNKPLIFEAHELPLSEESKRWPYLSALATNILNVLMSRCTGIITSSPLYVHDMQGRYHIPEITIIRNIPPYRSVAKSNRLRQLLGLGPNVRIALYQGCLQPNRALDRLILAAPFLESDIVIVLMGPDYGATKAQLEALIVAKGVNDHVKILPPVPYEELLDWTASADIGLVIQSPDYSRHIRFFLPNKLFEYLMAGLPVLTSELDAVAEVIRTYDVGKVTSALAPREVGSAINAMLADVQALNHMRCNALEATQHDLCWERESTELICLYQNILKREVVKCQG
jgi:glycosyltransferase involved in cell wall biosynthesis